MTRRLVPVPDPDTENALLADAYDLGVDGATLGLQVPAEAGEASDVTRAFDLGRRVERNAKGEGFADGLRVGITLFARLMAGDTELAAQIGRLV